ncbi:hypothetical protein BDV93DRAFT_607951 [Ceratobasidium sp. AG-I]|nr:hypothetical protein BDV93DRAFT_607951 [Ceratobasidium sp. AG-I]
MPKETKKRKLNVNAAAPPQTETSATSTDRKALKDVLKHCHGPTLAETLLSTLDDASPADVQALKDLMAPLIYAVAHPKHCLRCHESYDNSRNHPKACVVECNVPDDFVGRTRDGEGYMEFPCCGKEVTESDLDEGGYDVCYKDYHTDDPKEVEYYIRYGRGQTHDSAYMGPNNSNVIPCGEKGCNIEDSTE